MENDLAAIAVATKMLALQTSAQYAVLKKQHQMEMSLIDMLAQAAQAPAPEGQGLSVDKTA